MEFRKNYNVIFNLLPKAKDDKNLRDFYFISIENYLKQEQEERLKEMTK